MERSWHRWVYGRSGFDPDRGFKVFALVFAQFVCVCVCVKVWLNTKSSWRKHQAKL